VKKKYTTDCLFLVRTLHQHVTDVHICRYSQDIFFLLNRIEKGGDLLNKRTAVQPREASHSEKKSHELHWLSCKLKPQEGLSTENARMETRHLP